MPTPQDPNQHSDELEIDLDAGHPGEAPAGTVTPPPAGAGSGAYPNPYASQPGAASYLSYPSYYASQAPGGAAPPPPPPPPPPAPGLRAASAGYAPPGYPSMPPNPYASSPVGAPSGAYAAPPVSHPGYVSYASVAPSAGAAAAAPGQPPRYPSGAEAPPQAPPALDNLPTGAVIDDKYQILVKLGQGGMGAVYRARHRLLNKDVALKVIAPQMAQDANFRARFFREAKVAMEFVHRHAIPVRDFGVTRDGLYYMTMDFSTGRSLRAVVETEGALRPDRAVRITRMILEALAEAHRKRIVHRDLKPDNVMLEEQDGQDFVKVLDFGLAKMVAGEDDQGTGQPSLATGESVIGTPAYMSPEQACGEPVDHRADLYSTGIVLYQLLTGHLPFKASTSRQLILKHISAQPPGLREFKPDLEVPEALERVVYKALAKEREARYQTAEEFSRALEPFATAAGVAAALRASGAAPAAGGGRQPIVQIGGGEHAGLETEAAGTHVPEEIEGSLTGHTIDRYKILAPIAEGGMGAVYRAEHLLMHRECAFKVIKGNIAKDEEVLARFQREAQVSAKFKHPSAVEVYDFGRMGSNMFFMAMELVNGRSLTKRIEEQGALPLKDVIEIACQTLDVLDAAHKVGIVHRDLKPDNIMLQEADGWPNQVKVLDFGIAKMKETKGQAAKFQTQQGVFFGTPQYSSPEQCRGESVDGRSDIYSLGCIVYEMLTGKLPFESETAAGYLVQHIVQPPKKLREMKADLPPDFPPEVEAVIFKALEKAPEKRFQSAHDFAEALKNAAQMWPTFEVGEHGVRLGAGGRRLVQLKSAKKFAVVLFAVAAIVAIVAFFAVKETTTVTLGKIVIQATPGDLTIAVLGQAGEQTTYEVPASGEFVLSDLAPGRYTILFGKDGYERVQKEVEVSDGQEVSLPVTLEPYHK